MNPVPVSRRYRVLLVTSLLFPTRFLINKVSVSFLTTVESLPRIWFNSEVSYLFLGPGGWSIANIYIRCYMFLVHRLVKTPKGRVSSSGPSRTRGDFFWDVPLGFNVWGVPSGQGRNVEPFGIVVSLIH